MQDFSRRATRVASLHKVAWRSTGHLAGGEGKPPDPLHPFDIFVYTCVVSYYVRRSDLDASGPFDARRVGGLSNNSTNKNEIAPISVESADPSSIEGARGA